MPDEPETTPPTPEPSTEAPQWAQDLKRTIEELPSKLRATISDDDKTSIAETVHGLFDKSGAFVTEQQAETEQQQTETEQQQTEQEAEQQPERVSGMRKFASWFEGR